jgi:hypothetical protein
MDTKEVIKSQYGASLEMLRSAIEACPEKLWDSDSYKNRFWHIAYHALFYTDLYLSGSEEDFTPWEKSRPENNFLGPLPWPPHKEPEIGESYSRSEILEYWDIVSENLSMKVDAVSLDQPSGFEWLPFNRLELHFYNIRHIQHHGGQLIERLRQNGKEDIDWVGMKRHRTKS